MLSVNIFRSNFKSIFNDLAFAVGSSTMITLFLCYIDEGNYNLNAVFDEPTFFFMYAIPFTIGQCIMLTALKHGVDIKRQWVRWLLSFVAGVPLGLALLFGGVMVLTGISELI